jgi:AcrR family transcriptional regulator
MGRDKGKPEVPSGERRPRGRPNDSSIDEALLEAAYDEFVKKGYHTMSMEAIAARAGVSKVSLYRRWNSKAEIAADVFKVMNGQDQPIEAETLEAYVQKLMHTSIHGSGAREYGRLVMRTIGEIVENPELLTAYRGQLLMPGLEQLRQVIDRARQRGEIAQDLSTDAVCAVIAGPLFLYYLVLLAKADIKLDGDAAEQISRLIMDGINPSR